MLLHKMALELKNRTVALIYVNATAKAQFCAPQSSGESTRFTHMKIRNSGVFKTGYRTCTAHEISLTINN